MIYYPTYITHPKYTSNKAVAAIIDFRAKVIAHHEQHGLKSALDAFNLGRATLFRWEKTLRDNNGLLVSLAPVSTAPHTKRRRHSYPFHSKHIIRLRDEHPNLGKAKLKPMLDDLCIQYGEQTISESTMGRLIGDLKQSGRLNSGVRLGIRVSGSGSNKVYEVKPRKRIKKRRRGNYYPKHPGDLVQVDCITKYIDGIRRYVISAIDYKSSFAYSYAYKTLTSANARDFFLKLQAVAPFTIIHIQTDNGAEFHKCFIEELDYQQLVHFWNYPKTPKSNGKIERYNRTIQEEFVDYQLGELRDNIHYFNAILTDWLIYYNTERPHFAHKTEKTATSPSVQMPPMKALACMLQLNEQKSNMLWTHTRACPGNPFNI